MKLQKEILMICMTHCFVDISHRDALAEMLVKMGSSSQEGTV